MPLYFAYGSNLDAAQMERRCPGARLVGTAVLEHHRLTFAGRSGTWGGGVATLARERNAVVYGAVYEITAEHLHNLDRAEGAPFAYERRRRELSLAGERRRPWCYIKPSAVPAAPSRDYLARITAGYRSLGLPLSALTNAVRRGAHEAAAQLELWRRAA